MFQGFFEWVMGMITYVLSFFGIIISKPTAGGSANGGSDVAQVADEAEASTPSESE
jgi:hypothetical protein